MSFQMFEAEGRQAWAVEAGVGSDGSWPGAEGGGWAIHQPLQASHQGPGHGAGGRHWAGGDHCARILWCQLHCCQRWVLQVYEVKDWVSLQIVKSYNLNPKCGPQRSSNPNFKRVWVWGSNKSHKYKDQLQVRRCQFPFYLMSTI